MRCTVFSYGNTGVCCTDLYVQVRISYRVSYLFKSTSCCKHCKRTCKRNFSCGGKTCCDTDHVTLSDTTVNMAFRKYFLKHTGFGGSCQVCIQNYQVFVLFSQFYQGVTITFSGCNFLYF